MSMPEEPAGTVVEAVKLEAPLLPLTTDPDPDIQREARLLQADGARRLEQPLQEAPQHVSSQIRVSFQPDTALSTETSLSTGATSFGGDGVTIAIYTHFTEGIGAMTAQLNRVSEALSESDAHTVLSGAWDALDLAGRLADAIAWDEASDELQALIVAQECFTARDLLPAPETGDPLNLAEIEPGTAGLAPYIGLLDRTQGALVRLASAGDSSTGAQSRLSEAARHASAAREALTTVREQ
ncbi:hypothetical protein ABZS95_38360 [Streptomyces sp. NPDC005479]|uniref:hypothetical protein n=1 Tax=unclassified Streptomyces TaxID=2593676 RepID=UPI0033AE7C87